MDVFDLRDRLIGDYSSYAPSVINIRDERVLALDGVHTHRGPKRLNAAQLMHLVSIRLPRSWTIGYGSVLG